MGTAIMRCITYAPTFDLILNLYQYIYISIYLLVPTYYKTLYSSPNPIPGDWTDFKYCDPGTVVYGFNIWVRNFLNVYIDIIETFLFLKSFKSIYQQKNILS